MDQRLERPRATHSRVAAALTATVTVLAPGCLDSEWDEIAFAQPATAPQAVPTGQVPMEAPAQLAAGHAVSSAMPPPSAVVPAMPEPPEREVEDENPWRLTEPALRAWLERRKRGSAGHRSSRSRPARAPGMTKSSPSPTNPASPTRRRRAS